MQRMDVKFHQLHFKKVRTGGNSVRYDSCWGGFKWTLLAVRSRSRKISQMHRSVGADVFHALFSGFRCVFAPLSDSIKSSIIENQSVNINAYLCFKRTGGINASSFLVVQTCHRSHVPSVGYTVIHLSRIFIYTLLCNELVDDLMSSELNWTCTYCDCLY